MDNDAGAFREKAAEYRRLAAEAEQESVFELWDVAAHFEALAAQREAAAPRRRRRTLKSANRFAWVGERRGQVMAD